MDAVVDYLQCPRRFELIHKSEDPIPPMSLGTRARRSQQFQEALHSLLVFFLFRSMSGQVVPLATLLARWGRAFLKDYDNVRDVMHESHEVSSQHLNLASLNTIGVNVITDFHEEYIRKGYKVMEIMRNGILILPSARRVKAEIHYVRSAKRRGPEVVYLYTGLQKPSLRLYTWPLLASGLLYEQEYGVRPQAVLSCPAVQPSGKEYKLEWREGLIGDLDDILSMVYASPKYLPDYAGSCIGCPAGEVCGLYGWRGLY